METDGLVWARVAAVADRMRRPVPGPPEPEWARRAGELEAANRLEEAERTILEAVPHLGAIASVAELYATRMRRLARSGDPAGAAEARIRAREWIIHYASQATSGGEGAALSLERDQFLARLEARAEGGA